MEKIIYKNVFEAHQTVFYENSSKLSISKELIDTLMFTASNYNTLWTPINSSPIYGEEIFLQNYRNPLTQIRRTRLTIIISEKDNKLSIKTYYNIYERKVGTFYFKKNSFLEFVTYNFKTHNLYSGTITNYHKNKNIKKLNCNFFISLPYKTIINNIGFKINNLNNYYNGEAEDEVNKINTIVKNYITEIINLNNLKHIDDIFFKKYLDKNNIKYPNNWEAYRNILFPLPQKKELKKYNNKLVNYIMTKNSVNGDKMRKILHTVDKLNFDLYNLCVKFFGKNFIQNIPSEDIKLILENNITPYLALRNHNFKIFNTDKEINNCYKIFKLSLFSSIEPIEFVDHLNIYTRLKRHKPLKFSANDIHSFNEEHLNWSNEIIKYEDGLVKRGYNNDFINYIESQIINDIHPKILTTTAEYNEESLIQNHCVKTYSKTPKSLIISLRKGNIKSKDRVTLEYEIIKQTKYGIDYYYVNLKQAKGRFNKVVEDDYKDSIDLITKCFNNVINNKLNIQFTTPTIEVIFNNKKTNSSQIYIPITETSNDNIINYYSDWDNMEIQNIHTQIVFPADEFEELPF